MIHIAVDGLEAIHRVFIPHPQLLTIFQESIAIVRNDGSIFGDDQVFYHLFRGTRVMLPPTELGSIVVAWMMGLGGVPISYADTTVD